MKLKIIISIIAGIAILQCINTDTPVGSNSDHALPSKVDGSPQYKDGKFKDMGYALNMSFKDYASTTWDFLFTAIIEHRTRSCQLNREICHTSTKKTAIS